jgi:hypothetical protein
LEEAAASPAEPSPTPTPSAEPASQPEPTPEPVESPTPAAPAPEAAPPEAQPKAEAAAQRGLLGSLTEALWLYARNADRVWFFTMRSGFGAIGALFQGKVFQVGLAVTDFFLRLKSRQPSPDANYTRIMDLSSEQLGGSLAGAIRGIGLAIFAVLFGAIGAPVCFVLGLVVGAIAGRGVLVGFIAALVVLALASFMYFRALATMVLGLGVAIKFGPAGLESRREEAQSLLRRKMVPFALFLDMSFGIALLGLLLLIVGIFVTIPYFPTAMYVGMINTLGITEQDVEKFLKE